MNVCYGCVIVNALICCLLYNTLHIALICCCYCFRICIPFLKIVWRALIKLSVYRKQPLYLYKLGVRSAYTTRHYLCNEYFVVVDTCYSSKGLSDKFFISQELGIRSTYILPFPGSTCRITLGLLLLLLICVTQAKGLSDKIYLSGVLGVRSAYILPFPSSTCEITLGLHWVCCSCCFFLFQFLNLYATKSYDMYIDINMLWEKNPITKFGLILFMQLNIPILENYTVQMCKD